MKLPECKYEGNEMDLAVLTGPADVGLEDHGVFTLFANFDYGGGGQGLGYSVDVDFIRQFIGAFGAMRLSQCEGRHVFVEHNWGKIDRLVPLDTNDGEEFDIREYCDKCKEERNE